MTDAQASTRAWRGVIAAACANLCGNGLARFAFTPLIPALVAAGWFAPGAAVQLGAANLAGYLAGALAARQASRHLGTAAVLRGSMVAASASFFATAFPAPFAWFAAWRFLAGLAGAMLMVLAAPSVLPAVPPARRGLASGLIFTGVGLGIAASGTLLPVLLRFGLGPAWQMLGGIALLLTALAWNGWPAEPAPSPAFNAPPQRARADPRLLWLYAAYGLNAVALVPHMVFLADWVARGLGQGIAAASMQWALFGLGAMAGPVLLGRLGDRVGFGLALRLSYAAQAAAVLLPLAVPGALWVCGPLVGAAVPGITALTLGRITELVPDRPGQAAAWRLATLCFAVGLAAAGYGFAALFTLTGQHRVLFLAAAAVLLLILAADLLAARLSSRPGRGSPG